MKNFDTVRNERQSRERSFVIGGTTFTYRASVAPESLLAWDERGEKTGKDFLDVIDETVIAFLEPGQEMNWINVRQADDPVNINDIVDVIQWLFEEQAGRPTGPSSASTNGHDSTATDSTVVSFSPVTQPA